MTKNGLETTDLSGITFTMAIDYHFVDEEEHYTKCQ